MKICLGLIAKGTVVNMSKNDIKPHQCPEKLDALYPCFKEISAFLDAIDDANIKTVQEADKTVWLESEEYGLFRPDFLQAFMKLETMQRSAAV